MSRKYSIVIDRFRIDALIAKVARCGGYNLGFEAELKVTTNSLDDEGFVVHNEKLVERIGKQFGYGNYEGEGESCDSSVVWRASCEELTSGIANVIASMIPAERLVSMDIKVFNHMGHTALTWEQGDEIPEFPRLATESEIEETKKANQRSGIMSSC